MLVLAGLRIKMMKLTSSNYWIWKSRMKDFLICNDLCEPIYGDESKPSDMSAEDWEIMSRETVAHIRLWIDKSLFLYVSHETNAHSLWKKLESMFERKTVLDKLSVITRLMNLKYKDDCSSIMEHMSKFHRLVNQLKSMEIVLNDEVKALWLMATLPSSWDPLIESLSDSAPKGVLTMDMVIDGMLKEEAMRKLCGLSSEFDTVVRGHRGRSKSRVPQTRGKSRGKSKSRKNIECYHCGVLGHMKKDCRQLDALVTETRGRSKSRLSQTRGVSRDKSRGMSKSRKNIECYHCGELGHMKRECRQLKKCM